MADEGVEVMSCLGWADSVRLSNDDVEIVVAPSVGRIIYYGWKGGANFLWHDSGLEGHTGALADGAWANVGGDKTWPWPVEPYWPPASGNTKQEQDPPHEWERQPHRVEVIGPRAIRMTSAVWEDQGLRVVRDIRLEESGSRVTIETVFERANGEGPAIPVVPWSVTQMLCPEAVLVDYQPGYPRPYGLLLGHSWSSLLEINDDLLWLPSPGGVSKIGVSGRALGWWRGDALIVQRLRSPDADDANGWKPYEQAQIFWNEYPGEDVSPYVELEFTGPLDANNQGVTPPLIVTWEIVRLSSDRPRMDEVVNRFRQTISLP
jgi:hypothetical protein